jgi:hypothetical protein
MNHPIAGVQIPVSAFLVRERFRFLCGSKVFVVKQIKTAQSPHIGKKTHLALAANTGNAIEKKQIATAATRGLHGIRDLGMIPPGVSKRFLKRLRFPPALLLSGAVPLDSRSSLSGFLL